MENAYSLPEFFRNRVKDFYRRFNDSWGGYPIAQATRASDENAVALQSNDYLQLASHPEIISTQLEALIRTGSGPNMSAVYQEEIDPQRELERELAAFVGHDAAILCQSGFNANLGLLPALSADKAPIYIDMQAHSSLWWGAALAETKIIRFRHNSPESLERHVRDNGPGILVFETVYSTDGSVCPLRDLTEIGTRYGCLIVVDESHSLGVLGPEGRGLVYETGLTGNVHFITASLAKAFAGIGGFFSCPNVTEYFRYNHHPAIFSSSMEPHMAVRFLKTMEVIKRDDWRRLRVAESACRLRNGLDDLGFNTGKSESQIVSIEPGEEKETVIVKRLLEENGIFASVFCFPATAKKRSIMRFSVNCSHEREQIDRTLWVCALIRRETNSVKWPSSCRESKSKIFR